MEFKKVSKTKYGYDPAQVDDFIALARQQFENPKLAVMTAQKVRENQFELVKGGYLIAQVDAGIDQLEDALAKRELHRARVQLGDYMMKTTLERFVASLKGRLALKRGRRFSHRTLLLRGYSRREVDRFCAAVEAHLAGEKLMSVADVRNTVFSAKRGGYAENEVDAFIDRVVEVLQLEKALR